MRNNKESEDSTERINIPEDKNNDNVSENLQEAQDCHELQVVQDNRELAARDNKEKKSRKNNKLPKIFRKKYTVRRFQRKILKKIYIPSDKEYIKSLFIQEDSDNPKKPGKYYIPEELHFDTKELRTLKSLAKQIKKQKGRIKIIPLIAAFSFIFAVIIFVISTKDVFIRRKIKSFFEYQFEAKCDISDVSLKLLDSSFTVRDFQIADKNSPMKNIFSFDSLIIDFDLLQLLNARFVAEELSINGMDSGTKRSYNGTLPEGQLNEIRADKRAKAEKAEENKEKITTALNTATDKVKDNVKDSIVEIFNTFNPQIIMESCYSQFETPDMAERMKDEAVIFVDKWKETPERVNIQVQNIKTSTENIINFDYAAIKDDLTKIRDMLDNFQAAADTLEGVKIETENILYDIQEDVNKVNVLLKDVQSSIEHDIGIGRNKIDELKSFQLPSGQEFLASTIDIYGHELLGKYYPMLKKGAAYIISLKDKQIPKKININREKKPGIKRAEGRNIDFVSDYYPKFWIKKIKVSGFNMETSVTDITNNMNITNRPTEVLFRLDNNDIKYGGKAEIDTRIKTSAPLVYLEYTCDGTSFAHDDNIPGVPAISSNADYLCNAKIYDDRPFVLNGIGKFYNLDLSTPFFEPAYVHDIYNSILGRFDSAEVGMELIIDGVNSMSLNAYTDLDEKIAEAFKDEINLRLAEVKAAIEAELAAKIEFFKEKAMIIVDKLYAIEERVQELENQLYELEDRLMEKRDELEDRLMSLQQQIEDKLQEKAEEVKSKVEDTAIKVQEGLKQESQRVQNEIEDKIKETQEATKEHIQNKIEDGKKAAEDAIKGFLGGFGRR